MFVCCDCCLVSGRDLCDELIIRGGGSKGVGGVVGGDREIACIRGRGPAGGGGCGGVVPETDSLVQV